MTGISIRVIFLTATVSIAACGGKEPESATEPEMRLSAATLGQQTVMAVPEYQAQDKFRNANQNNGSRQAQICKACHSFEDGGANMIGPALYGFFGREVGQQAGFDYSPVMRNASFVWTPRALDAWLANPGKFLPGNRMVIPGVARQQDRDDLIAYLLETTAATGDE